MDIFERHVTRVGANNAAEAIPATLTSPHRQIMQSQRAYDCKRA